MSAHPQTNPGPVGSIRFTQPWSNHADQQTDPIVAALLKERDALAERVKSLISERDTARMQADRKVTLRDEFRSLLGTDDIEEGVNLIKAMQARVKDLEAYADRLEQEGHWLAQCVPQNDADRWHKAKETKP